MVISRLQQPIVKINVQFVLNGSPPHLADSLSCCNLAIELSRNLVTENYLAACIVCLSVCLREGAAARKLNEFCYGRCRKFNNMDFQCSQHSPNITRFIQSVRRAECVTRMEYLINTVNAAYNGRTRGRIFVVFDRFRFI